MKISVLVSQCERNMRGRGHCEDDENDQTRDRWLDFRRMQVASDQITLLVESSDDITQDSEVFVPVRIVLDSVSLTRSNIQE